MTDDAEILFAAGDGIATVTLNRPAALNALTLGMVREFHPKLIAWAADDAVRAVVVRGAGEKAFCAGGDIRALYDNRGTAFTADFFREEYRLNRTIHHYPKPYVALMDGITMGGGVGVSVHARHRVVSEATMLAMPETGIGLFPDVGGSYFLPRMPGATGMYIALTGDRLRPADCVYAGIADAFVPRAEHNALVAALPTEPANAVLDRMKSDPGPASLEENRDAIDRCFSHESVAAIQAALAAEDSPWASKVRAVMRGKSPLSQKVTFRQIREGANLSFDDCMRMEFRMSQHFMAGQEFFEGVRALVVDKDQKPAWQHATLDDVSDAEVDEYFAPLDDGELTFED